MATSDQVRSILTRALAAWSVGSIAVGALVLLRRPGTRATGFARQSIAWGAVDLAIAGLSLRRRDPVADEAAQARSLRRLLLVNAALDVGYVSTCVLLWRAGRLRGRDSTGDGAGVVLQGAFLLVLDAACASALRPVPAARRAGALRGGTTRL